MRKFLKRAATSTAACAMLAMMAPAAHAQEQQNVEVLHWWTAGGEAAALDVLKKDLESKGIRRTDRPVGGRRGTEPVTVLRARVNAGNAPTAGQRLGFEILDWAEPAVLGNLAEVAN